VFNRCNLSNVVLQLLAIGVPDVANFDFMDIPSPEVCTCVESSLNQLYLAFSYGFSLLFQNTSWLVRMIRK
jgi:hypothetical protein